MSLDKAIAHGKEKRKPYRGAKAIDYSCRNHGSCECCKTRRLLSSIKRLETMKGKEEEYEHRGDV